MILFLIKLQKSAATANGKIEIGGKQNGKMRTVQQIHTIRSQDKHNAQPRIKARKQNVEA
jgi:hypothetical protein